MTKTNKFNYVAFATRQLFDGKKVKVVVTRGEVITQTKYNKLPESSQDCFWPVGMCELIDEIQNGPKPQPEPVINTFDYSNYSNILPAWNQSFPK